MVMYVLVFLSETSLVLQLGWVCTVALGPWRMIFGDCMMLVIILDE